MCFSASASFGAGVVLTVIGVATIKKSQHSSQLLFASIPLIFGVQQIAEGILWISLPNPDSIPIQKIFTTIFLFFAQVLWPIWVPIAIMHLEKKETRTKFQKVLVAAGAVVGSYLAYCLLVFHVEAKIMEHHISYVQDYPAQLRKFVLLFYAMSTIVPAFFSHIKHIWLLGATILIAYLVTAFFYEHYILSVWCFFSSIISLLVYAVIIEINKAQRNKSFPEYT
jgi:hypothetical protein